MRDTQTITRKYFDKAAKALGREDVIELMGDAIDYAQHLAHQRAIRSPHDDHAEPEGLREQIAVEAVEWAQWCVIHAAGLSKAALAELQQSGP